MTETNAYGPGNNGQDYIDHPTSTGRATPILELAVRDEAGPTTSPSASAARSGSRARTSSAATGTSRRPRPRRSSTAGCAAATSAGSTTRASSTSRTGPRTWSCGPARTCTAPRSRPPSTSTPPCTRLPCSACPTSASARRWRPWSTCAPATTSTSTTLQAHVGERLASFKVPSIVAARPRAAPPQPSGQDPQARPPRHADRLSRPVAGHQPLLHDAALAARASGAGVRLGALSGAGRLVGPRRWRREWIHRVQPDHGGVGSGVGWNASTGAPTPEPAHLASSSSGDQRRAGWSTASRSPVP